MTDEEALKILEALDRNEAAHEALIAVAAKHHCPALLGAADALFGCRVRPMFESQAGEYHEGYVHACATHGIEAEPDEHDHLEPVVDCRRFYGPVHVVEPPWHRHEWAREHFVEQQPAKRFREDREAVDELAELLLAAHPPDSQYGWYLVGWLVRLFVWPTRRPETPEESESLYRGFWALPEDSDQEWLADDLWREYEPRFPSRVACGPEPEMVFGVRYQ